MIAQYKEAKANLDAFQARVRDTELTVWQDVQQSYLTMISAEQQIGAAQKAVDSAQENFQLSQGRFDAGVANIIELTDAQLALTQAQSSEAQALANYRIAIAQLERAIGRRYYRACRIEGRETPDPLVPRGSWRASDSSRVAISTARAWAAAPRSGPSP